MRTIALTKTPQIEVISAYCIATQQVPAVNGASAWYVLGSFFMPVTETVRLEVIGLVSEDDIVMNVRLFDVTDAALVGGTGVDVDSLVDQRVTSGRVQLSGGHLFQFQAQVLSSVSTAFGVVNSAALI